MDGVRALWDGEKWLSRSGKPLRGVPSVPGLVDCELYLGSFRDTIRVIKTVHARDDTPVALPEHLYSLDPLDERLHMCVVTDPRRALVLLLLELALARGREGLVLRQAGVWLKVKPRETHDVKVRGYVEGEGKHAGRLGSLLTDRGGVGTGFDDAEREQLWSVRDQLIGMTIEVDCMQFTPDGKFRHGRFVRLRPDK